MTAMPRLPQPAKGDRIDGFTLGEKLHDGGFSSIWQVTNPAIPLPMVMKIPTLGSDHDAAAIVGFEVEQMILPRLTGPHVPRVLASGDFSARPFLVTERIPGQSMWALVKRAPLPLDEVIEIAARMAQAVHDLHRQHVIHLDLKPDNFLQRPSGDMVLIDYGLSRHDHLPDLLAEEFPIAMGTFPYIAPEQVLHQRGDPRSDLYALGVMIYQLATGKLPFGVPQDLKSVRARLWRDPMPPRALRRDLPEWLQEIILRALEVLPDRRYQSAAQMVFDLGHPMQVRLTPRAHKTARISFGEELRQRWRMRRVQNLGAPIEAAGPPHAQVLLVAVDLAPGMELLANALLRAVQRMLIIEPDARVACINVRPPAKRGLHSETGLHHVSRLVGLRTWAGGIDLPDDRLTFSVLESSDPASAILEHAAVVGADHIAMGARGHSTARRFLGSVSARVVAEAPCSVTVIRLPEGRTAQDLTHKPMV